MNKLKFFMLIGLPASGKSYKAQELAQEYNAEIFSSDALREELFGDVNHQDNNHELFNELHRRIKYCLKSGRSAIYDACNISYKRRMAFLQELKNIPCEKICVVMATPYTECLRRNAERERKVPEEVIKRMYMNFTIPYWYEGWSNIAVFRSGTDTYPFAIRCIDTFMNFDQEKSHHKLTLGEHLKETLIYVQEKIGANNDHHSVATRIAAVLHDCSKPFCKAFINGRGETTEEAHYYSHQYCSAYDSLFFRYLVDPIEVAIRVMWHMQPYFWERDNNEKQHNKYRKLWGEELYNDIMLLHEADKAAH